MTDEFWRPVLGWESHYEVSSLGRVRRIAGGQGAVAGRVLNPMRYRQGYLAVRLHGTHRQPKTVRVHQLVAAAFLARDAVRPQINHKNGITSDNRLENLEWCTPGENLLHSYRSLGRKAAPVKGAANFNAKLNEDEVRLIRAARRRGELYTTIARRFGITPAGAWRVATRLSWKHVADEVTQ